MFTEQIHSVKVTGQNAPIIFAGPHNGKRIPPFLYTEELPLGLPEDYFLNRHEASDLYAQELFETIWEKAPYIRTITGRLSRLVVDLNRISNRIPKESCDTGLQIPGNLELSEKEVAWRIKLYDEYHNKKCDLIKAARDKFGQVIYLDIHTFSRTHKGDKRTTDIGTFKPKASKLSRLVESTLPNYLNGKFTFAPNSPYDTTDSETNAGGRIAQNTNVDFLGIEICNDLLTTQASRNEIAAILINMLYDIMPSYGLGATLPLREDAIIDFNI